MENTRTLLVHNQPYYALLLQQSRWAWSEKIPTACVGYVDNNINLLINKEFFYSLPDDQKQGLLIHEMLHVLMGHLARGNGLNRQVANIAMDIAINQFIPRHMLPEGGLLPEHFKFEPNKSFEIYYDLLMEEAKKNPIKISELSSLDSHEGFGEGGNSIMAEIVAKAAHKSAVDALGAKGIGKVPKAISKIVEQLGVSKVKWQNVLRNYIGRSISKHQESTRTRPNRRQGFFAQGTKNAYYPKILIGIDQSGSVGDKEQQDFLNELNAIVAGQHEKVMLAYFDTEIHLKETIKKKLPEMKRVASGGTSFQCVFDYAQEIKPDLLVMFTDGEAHIPEKPKYPVLWVITQKESVYRPEITYGKIVYLDESTKQ